MATNPIGGSSNLNLGITSDADLSKVSADAGSLIDEQGGTLGADALELLKLQQKISEDTQRFSLISQILKDRDDAAKQAINNI